MSSRSSVDLPQPLAPTIATNSPGLDPEGDAVQHQRPVLGVAEGEVPGLDGRPESVPGTTLPPRTSGGSCSTGLICSYIGSTAAAEMSALVSWVTEVSSIVTAVLKVRNPLGRQGFPGRAGQQHEQAASMSGR